MILIFLLLSLLCASPSLAFDAAVGRFALNTSTGAQDLTFPDFTEDCTQVTCAAIFVTVRATADNTQVDDAAMSFGFTDGTNQGMAAIDDDHGVSTTDSSRETRSGRVISLSSAAGVDTIASFSSWLDDGVQINITDAPPTASFVTVAIIGGSGLSADVGQFSSNGSIDGTTDVTTVGFEAEILFLTGTRLANVDQTSSTYLFTAGVAANDGSDTQGSIGCFSHNGQSTTNPHALTSTLYAAHYTDQGGADTAVQIGSWDSSGFTATTKVVGTAANLNYLALAFGGPDSAVIDIATPTATGVDSETIGFNTLLGMIFGTLAQAYDTDEDDSDGGQCMISMFTDNNQYSNGVGVEDGVTTSNTYTVSNDEAVVIEQDDGTCSAGTCLRGTLAIDATEWDITYSSVFSGAARQFIGFALEDETPAETGRRRGVQVIQ